MTTYTVGEVHCQNRSKSWVICYKCPEFTVVINVSQRLCLPRTNNSWYDTLEDTLGSISYDDYRDMLFNWFYYHDMTHRREPVLWGKRLSTSIIDKIIAVC